MTHHRDRNDNRVRAEVSAAPDDWRMRDEVLSSLRASPKWLHPKLFYDADGAALFERICTLPEYYLTRAELEILTARAGEMAELVGPRCALVEYGSGAGVKVRRLLDAMHAVAYVPIDISGEQLARVAEQTARDYPGLVVKPVLADYTKPVELPALPAGARRVAFFPGSTIGNFHPTEATAFLRRVRRTLGENGALIIGVDRMKDEQILIDAYDDRAGVTAAFNRNVLRRINRELGGTFDVDRFDHEARVDHEAARVEMHLVSRGAQRVTVAGETFDFADGETIWTESSYKYDDARLDAVAASGGFAIANRWTDGRGLFWVALLTAA